MSLYMLDTDTVSYFLKGRSKSVEARLSELSRSEICISVVTRAELRFGLKQLHPRSRLHLTVPMFLEDMKVCDWGSAAADFYADIRYALTRNGQLIGHLDMMIAAHAMAMRAILVTNNTAHFTRIAAPLRVENWHSGD